MGGHVAAVQPASDADSKPSYLITLLYPSDDHSLSTPADRDISAKNHAGEQGICHCQLSEQSFPKSSLFGPKLHRSQPIYARIRCPIYLHHLHVCVCRLRSVGECLLSYEIF